MWTGKSSQPGRCGFLRPYWKRCVAPVSMLCVTVLVLTAPGCSSGSSVAQPALPVLPSLQRLELNGTPGVWMSSDDAGRLALWLYDVTGEDGL